MSRRTPPPPIVTRGERLLAALIYLLILPLALLAGWLVYGVTRRTRPFLAAHSAQAAGWQLTYLALNVASEAAIIAYALGHGYPLPFLIRQIGYLASLPPALLRANWPRICVPLHALCLTVACLDVVFIAGALWGADRALRGRPFQAPVIGRLFARSSSPHTL